MSHLGKAVIMHVVIKLINKYMAMEKVQMRKRKKNKHSIRCRTKRGTMAIVITAKCRTNMLTGRIYKIDANNNNNKKEATTTNRIGK